VKDTMPVSDVVWPQKDF